jgi:hypothetical protein
MAQKEKVNSDHWGKCRHRVDWHTNKLDTQKHSISNVLDSQIFQEVLLLIPQGCTVMDCNKLFNIVLFFFRFWHSAVIAIYRGIFPGNSNTLTERKTILPKKKVLFIVHSKEKIHFNKQLRITQNNKTATSQLGTLMQV